MKYRTLGKTGFKISEVSLGTWQVGGGWGRPFNEKKALEILNRAVDLGVNFIDTADVYGNGLSEKMAGQVARSCKEKIFVATKCGRKISPHTAEGYTPPVLERFVEDSLRNLKLEAVDLLQLHCPPTAIYERPEIFALFEKLKDRGKIRFFGVSVEKMDEAFKAIEYPNVASVQIIFNMFRHRPKELFFKRAKENNIGIIARVPLASGLLSGTMTPETKFPPGDHRSFNRHGEAFDKGETFSGVDLSTGLKAVAAVKKLFPEQPGLASWALKWILMSDAVSCVIPGASSPEQVEKNTAAGELPDMSPEIMAKIDAIYEELIKPAVHHLW
jgi:aryl-alcohol dehydrogenase-like predicted oxidoreductase